jgi:hypothetical protein
VGCRGRSPALITSFPGRPAHHALRAMLMQVDECPIGAPATASAAIKARPLRISARPSESVGTKN